jgi:PAS domain S-box-containing protein
MVTLTGLSREQSVGSTSWQALIDGRPARAFLQDDGGSAAACELTIMDPDRPRIVVSCTATVLTGDTVGATQVLIIARDVSAQRRLAEASGALAAIVQSSHDAIVGKSLDGVITSWNPEAERLYGYPAEEMLGRLAEVLVPPELREAEMHTLLRRIAAGERVDSYETERVRKDGTRVAVSWGSSPIRDHRGQVVGAASISRDLSERERSDAAFRAVLNASADAIIGVDSSGRITLANAQTETMFNHRREDLIGGSIEVLIPDSLPEVRARHRAALDQSPMPGTHGERLGFTGHRPDGGAFPVEVGLSNLDTADGPLVLATVRDVSERHRIEQELREKNDELERASRSKDNFLSSMSHELRTPLNAIIGFTGTLLMRLPGPLNTEQTSQLETVQASGKHLLMIINDLLDLARIESGRTQITLESVDCRVLAEHTVEALQPLAMAKGLRLFVDAPDGQLMATTDRRALGQILINLANNAVKFTERGEVRIRLAPATTDQRARIMVSDTGPGIPTQDQERIFRAFERSAATAKASDEGTGLGLHISKRLSDLLGADLVVDSAVGEGATFTLSVDP